MFAQSVLDFGMGTVGVSAVAKQQPKQPKIKNSLGRRFFFNKKTNHIEGIVVMLIKIITLRPDPDTGFRRWNRARIFPWCSNFIDTNVILLFS